MLSRLSSEDGTSPGALFTHEGQTAKVEGHSQKRFLRFKRFFAIAVNVNLMILTVERTIRLSECEGRTLKNHSRCCSSLVKLIVFVRRVNVEI